MICVDANVVVNLIMGRGQRTVELWTQWLDDDETLVAPTLMPYEVTNALHRYLAAGVLDEAALHDRLHSALALDVELRAPTDLHARAARLAVELGRPATYDAHYLALADTVGGTFWTADRRLFNATSARFSAIRLVE